MPIPSEFLIACYMAWSGAEATFPFSNREDYERARTFLEKIAVGHVRQNELPPGYGSVTDLYFMDVKDRDAFREIMKPGK